MPSEQPLMRPLRSDSLKPRPSVQASWTPKDPVYSFDTSALPLAASAEADIPSVPQPLPEPELFPETASSSYNEEDLPTQPQQQPASLSESIADLISFPDEVDDDDESPVMQDAVPDRLIPEPVCVPLFEQTAPTRSKRVWLWLVLPIIAAAGLYAAWKYGFLSFILS